MLTWLGYGLRGLGGHSIKTELLVPCLVVARPSDRMPGYLILKDSSSPLFGKLNIPVSLPQRLTTQALSFEFICGHGLSSPILHVSALNWAAKSLEHQPSSFLCKIVIYPRKERPGLCPPEKLVEKALSLLFWPAVCNAEPWRSWNK